ncbi:MAG: hypothetical protein ACPIOQ_84850, partial [Promethearchaeia archaeon]
LHLCRPQQRVEFERGAGKSGRKFENGEGRDSLTWGPWFSLHVRVLPLPASVSNPLLSADGLTGKRANMVTTRNA